MSNFYETEWERPELDTLSSLAHHLVYRLRECDDNVIRLSLQEVYRDFCRRSCCLRVRRRFERAPDGDYFVAPMFGGEVERVTEVCYRGRLLREGYGYFSRGGMVHIEGRANEEIVDDSPDASEPIEITWIEIPSLASEKIPKWLIRKHGDTICAGVMARLAAMSNRPWSDPQVAVIESNRYEAALNAECQKIYAVGDSGNLGSVFDTSDLI